MTCNNSSWQYSLRRL